MFDILEYPLISMILELLSGLYLMKMEEFRCDLLQFATMLLAHLFN